MSQHAKNVFCILRRRKKFISLTLHGHGKNHHSFFVSIVCLDLFKNLRLSVKNVNNTGNYLKRIDECILSFPLTWSFPLPSSFIYSRYVVLKVFYYFAAFLFRSLQSNCILMMSTQLSVVCPLFIFL